MTFVSFKFVTAVLKFLNNWIWTMALRKPSHITFSKTTGSLPIPWFFLEYWHDRSSLKILVGFVRVWSISNSEESLPWFDLLIFFPGDFWVDLQRVFREAEKTAEAFREANQNWTRVVKADAKQRVDYKRPQKPIANRDWLDYGENTALLE